jgi:hypothetical protein
VTRWLGCAAVSVLAASVMLGIAPGLARAFACGAVVSPDSAARVADEEALVTSDGLNETAIIRLGLLSTANNGALIVPTPQPAPVTTASPGIFDDLDALSAPRIETRRNWSFGASARSATSQARAPTVLHQVQLGPFEATTLAGGDVAGILQWLQSNGYTPPPEVVASLDPYLREGWSFVAMRLTSAAPLNGPLPPVRLVFAGNRLVYPMRMSTAAQASQHVVIYTLGEHRTQRIDPDAARQHVEVDYAGSIANRGHDPTLTELARHGAYLTRISIDIADPSTISSDFEFGPALNNYPYQRVSYRDVNENPTVVVIAAGVLVAAVAALVARFRRRRTSSAG